MRYKVKIMSDIYTKKHSEIYEKIIRDTRKNNERCKGKHFDLEVDLYTYFSLLLNELINKESQLVCLLL